MRKILFKAKRLDNGEWAYGDLFHSQIAESAWINTGNVTLKEYEFIRPVEVDPSTVCQFTGLTDKNGREIFEGDILLERDAYIWEDYTRQDGSKWSRMTNKREDKKYTVFFDEKTAQLTTSSSWLWAIAGLTDIIGSIHDAPVDKEGM